jgi:PAS domain S-box-containing protein
MDASPGTLPGAGDEALRESEARFRELADNISQFAWTADATGGRTWYNQRWYDYTGTTFEEVQGLGWQKLHHPDHLERVLKRFRKSFESGTPWEDTFPLRGRDGGYRWFLTRALPIRNDAGKVVRWLGTNTDVTERIEAEKALRELNETLEQRVEAETRERLQIWNVSQDLLMVADLEGRYLSVNPAWTATLGWPEADLLGKSSQWLLYPDDREPTRAEIAPWPPAKRHRASRTASATRTARTAGYRGTPCRSRTGSTRWDGTSRTSRTRRARCWKRAGTWRRWRGAPRSPP